MPTLQDLARIASKLLADLPQVQTQPETNRFGILLADALTEEIVGADAERHVWSHAKLDVADRLASRGSAFHARELLVDVNVWVRIGDAWDLAVAAECEAAPHQGCEYDRLTWWKNGYLFDLAKLLRLKAKHLLFVGRTDSVDQLERSIKSLLADAQVQGLALSEDQTLWVALLDHHERTRPLVLVARQSTGIEWARC